MVTVKELLPFYEYRKSNIAIDLKISPTAVTKWGDKPIPTERYKQLVKKHPDWFTKKGTLKAWNNRTK